MARIIRFLRSQRPNHVSHSDYYINWGETITSLSPKVGSEPIGKTSECEYDKQPQTEERQKSDSQSDVFIVLMILYQ